MRMVNRLDKLFSLALKGFLLLILIIGVAYIVTCSYANWWERSDLGFVEYPEVSEAEWEFTVENTGLVVLSNDWDYEGTTYILHGLYESNGKEWVYREGDHAFDEDNFGKIKVRKRQ